jgi:DNA-binding NtrC family response regulator
MKKCSEITILVVDDDAGFRNGLSSVLTDDGHEVLSYAGLAEIPFNGSVPPPHVLISDYEMSRENGFFFIDRFHERHLEVPVILVTAHQTNDVAAEAAKRGFLEVVWKPFEYNQIHAIVHHLAGEL